MVVRSSAKLTTEIAEIARGLHAYDISVSRNLKNILVNDISAFRFFVIVMQISPAAIPALMIIPLFVTKRKPQMAQRLEE